LSEKETLRLKPGLIAMEQETPPKATARTLVHSVAWNALGDWIAQIFSWACFVVVVRLLSPADYGIIAMSAAFGPLVAYFSGSGIPRAIVTLRDLTEDQLAQLNTVGLILGFVSFGLAAIIAKPIGMFYGQPRVAAVFVVSCTGLIFNGAQTVSNALLLKDMRFRTLTLFGTCAAILSSAMTLLFAWLGWGYWALVLGGLLGGILRVVLVMFTRRQTYAIPRWVSVKRPLTFAMYIVFGLIAWSFYQNLDNLTAGRFLGQTALGFYAMAWSLAYVPLDKVTSLITTVLPTYISAIQNDLVTVRRHFIKLTEGVATLMFPGCVGFGLVAHELIPLVMGAKWKGAVPPLEVLSIYAAFRSIVAFVPQVLTAVGYPRFVMWTDVSATFILGLAFYLGSHWGITGIAWGWVVAYPLVVAPLYRKTFSTIGMKPGEYVGCLLPALKATVVMTIAVELVKYAVSNVPWAPVRLGSEVLTGVLVYTASLWLIRRERITDLWQLTRQFRRA